MGEHEVSQSATKSAVVRTWKLSAVTARALMDATRKQSAPAEAAPRGMRKRERCMEAFQTRWTRVTRGGKRAHRSVAKRPVGSLRARHRAEIRGIPSLRARAHPPFTRVVCDVEFLEAEKRRAYTHLRGSRLPNSNPRALLCTRKRCHKGRAGAGRHDARRRRSIDE